MRASLYRCRTSLTDPVSWKLGSMSITSTLEAALLSGRARHTRTEDQTCFALHVHGLPCSRLSTSSWLCRLSNRQPPQAAINATCCSVLIARRPQSSHQHHARSSWPCKHAGAQTHTPPAAATAPAARKSRQAHFQPRTRVTTNSAFSACGRPYGLERPHSTPKFSTRQARLAGGLGCKIKAAP